MFFGCAKYELDLTYMDLSPVVNIETKDKSALNGWWYSEFQDNSLNFILRFSYTGYTGVINARYHIDDYPDENAVIITCNKDIYSDYDTIKAGELLNECFSVHKYEPLKFSLYFLISEKPSNDYLFNEQYYTFKFVVKSTKNQILTDSCIIKRF